MKRLILLAMALSAMWLLWSGHFDVPFILVLGATSVGLTVWVAQRMQIVDAEGAPIGLGLRPVFFAVWLAKEVVIANIEVTKRIIDPKLPLHPRMVKMHALQKTELGRVILANSITLTPGTVSVDMEGDLIWVHALSYEGAEDDLSGDMNEKIKDLER